MVSRTMLNLYRTAALDRITMGTSDALSTVVFLTTRADVTDPTPANQRVQDSRKAAASGDTAPVTASEAYVFAPLSSLA